MREWFEQYRAMVMRVKRLTEKLDSMQCITDTVRGSSAEFPYTLHPMTVSGRNAAEEEKVRCEIAQLISRIRAVEMCVEGVEDQEWKLVLELKYMDSAKRSWDDVADVMMLDMSGDALRKRAERFFRGLSGLS